MKELKSKKFLPLFVVVILFGVLPFVFNTKFIDPEMSVRFLLFALLIAFIQFYFFIGKNEQDLKWDKEFLLKHNVEILFAVFIIYCGLNIFRSYDSSAALYDWLRIFLMFVFFIQCLVLLNRYEGMRDYLILGIAISVFIFSFFGALDIIPSFIKAITTKNKLAVEFYFGSTLSNKNFYSETLFMTLPFLIDGYLRFKGFTKYIVIAALFLSLTTIIFLQSVAVIAALIICAIIFTLLFFIFKKGNETEKKTSKFRIKKSVIACIILSIVISGILYANSNNYENLKLKISTFHNFLNYNGDPEKETPQDFYGSFTQRFLIWEHTMKMIKDYPVAGCGLSNWATLFPKYGAFGNRFMDRGNIRTEHPHNDYLFVTAELGSIGLIIYLSIFIFILIKLFFQIRSANAQQIRSMLLFCGIIGFMIISCFSYPKERFYSMLLLMIAFSFSLADNSQNNLSKTKSNSLTISKFYLLLTFSLTCFASYFFFIRMNGEIHFENALKMQKQKEWIGMRNEIVKAKSFALQSDLLATPLDWYAGFASFYSGNTSEAFLYFNNAVKINPYHIQAWNDLGTCYQQQKNYKEAINCYNKALSFNKCFYDAIPNLAAAYFNSGDIENAYQTIRLYPPMRKSPTYPKFLLAILKSKLNVLSQTVSDSLVKYRLLKKLNDDNYLIHCFEEVQSSQKKIDSIFIFNCKK